MSTQVHYSKKQVANFKPSPMDVPTSWGVARQSSGIGIPMRSRVISSGAMPPRCPVSRSSIAAMSSEARLASETVDAGRDPAEHLAWIADSSPVTR